MTSLNLGALQNELHPLAVRCTVPLTKSAWYDREKDVTSKYLWRVALICTLSIALSTETKADSLKTTGELAVAAIVAVVAVAVVVTVLVITHSTKNRTITGCVNLDESGMRMTDEKDKHAYALSGNTAGVKAGNRVTLMGKKIKPQADATFVWETKKITKDFGACQH
jgi:hypothetical protein